MKKLAIITTHPIQYYAPVFKLLHEREKIKIKVFYSWGEKSRIKNDPGFEKIIEWDLPLLEGYPFEWVYNNSINPGSHHFSGIRNPYLISQIHLWKPDALLVFGWAYQSHLQVLRFFKGKLPIYFRGDSTLLDEGFGLKKFFRNYYLKWIYSHVDHGFYVGTLNERYFLKYGIENTRLSFTPHAVDNNRFAIDRSKESFELRYKLGLDREDILVLFAGKFETKKNPILLLNAFKEVNNTHCHLLFVGNGELETKIKTNASATPSMRNRIHFMDFQNQTEMPVIYQACDLFCLPSKGPGESWGLAINEAMACGKAILASDKVGASYDLVKESKNGMIFKSDDLPSLIEKLNHLSANKQLLKNYGRQSKFLIEEWNFCSIALAIETAVITQTDN